MAKKPPPKDPTPDLFDSLPEAVPAKDPPSQPLSPTTSVGATPPQPPVPPVDGVATLTPEGSIPLAEFAERAYLAYAMSVVKGRALPSIEDGQKPVQRRILYAMREMGSRADQPFKKSARIVGDVIGKYHPHGDSAVYEAAVRMAQEFTLRYPLIEGQGNFGSRDGDAPAAMRYTEIRLSRFAEAILLAELDRGTVDFRDNYDGSMREPLLLPARLPILLLNGASGIAVGMATDMQPHNLREVGAACQRVVEQPSVSDDELLAMVPAPDFPGGGQIISPAEDIRRAYLSGKGSVRVRARYMVEPLARGQYRIAITELPPNTNTARVLGEIEELSNPKVKAGKKSLTPEQQSMKAGVLSLLDSARDDSDKQHPVRIVLEPRTSKVSAEELMALLLANTSLEANTSINMVTIGRDGRPVQANLPLLLREWASFRMHVVERRLAYRLSEVERRIHILEGRMIALLSIDAVIKVIREADEPKPELMQAFTLTDTQAEDILEIRLRQLARLEAIKIERELKELRTEEKSLKRLLSNETARRQLVATEIAADVALFGDARRTLVEAAAKVTASRIETVVDEAITLILSRNGFIRQRSGHGIDAAALTWKEGDGELAVIETRSVNPIVLVAENGRTFSVRAQELPGGKGDGAPVASLVDLAGMRVIAMLCGPNEARVFLAGSAGYGFFGSLSEMTTRQRAGKQYATIETGEQLLAPLLWPEAASEVAALSAEGRLLILPATELKALPTGGRGVIVMGLRDKESLIAVTPLPTSGALDIAFIGRGDKVMQTRISARDFDYYRGSRARMGKALDVKAKRMLGFVKPRDDA
jgi:topoisomerase IV subunit A